MLARERNGRAMAELRLASELSEVDCCDLAERTVRRVTEDRALAAGRVGDRPELLLRALPPPDTGPLLRQTLESLRSVPARHDGRTRAARRPSRWPPWPALASVAAASLLAVVWLRSDFVSRQQPLTVSPGELVVRKVNGRVDVTSLRGRKPAAIGDHLKTGDVLATVGDAEAVVAVGEHGAVVLDPFSRVRVARGGDVRRGSGVPELEVLRGRAEGRLAQPSPAPTFRFTVAGKSYGLVRGRIGVVRVSTDRYLLAAVSEAVVEADGVEVTVPEANVLRVSPGSTARPEPWPRTVALSLRQKEPIRAGNSKAVLVGRTSPDVILIINKVPVPVNRNGRFVATLSVPAKTDMLEAVVRDPMGRVVQRKRLPIVRAKSRVDWLEPG